MSRLFHREAELIIADVGDDLSSTGPQATTITDLRMVFRVEKQLSTDPNTCEIEISNLSESTRALLQRKPLRLTLSAGYEGAVKQLFTGDLLWAVSAPEVTGWLTKIQAGDGARAHKNARVNRSFKGGVQYGQILKEITKSMGLSIPQNADQARELVANLINGASISGPSHKELTRILEARGFSWSVQDGKLQILAKAEVNPNSAFVISADNGMVGSPGFGSPDKKGESPSLNIQNLLYPEIIPGAKLSVTSFAAKGLFRAERVQHSGDTHGDSWNTDIEATPL